MRTAPAAAPSTSLSFSVSRCFHVCRIPNASWDELDDLAIEVEVDKAEGGGEEAARAAARALLPTVRAKLEELLTRIKGYNI